MAMATRSHKLTGSAAGVLSYLKDESAVLDYYDADEGFQQVWGKLGDELGLDRGLTREQFTRAFNGQHPVTGEQLAGVGHKQVITPDGTVETVATRTGAIDVVYGCPKSVAVLYVQASPEMRRKLDALVLDAAHAAHDAMESSAKLARVAVKTPTEVGARTTKQQGSQTERVTADLLTVPTIQFVARPTPESEARGSPGVDPQIHVHATTLTLCKAGGRFLTADEFGLKNRANAKHRDAVFMGELARGLESIGVKLDYSEFDRAKGGEIRWEVKGTDEQLRRYWSTNNERAWAIRREYEEEHGKPINEVKLGEILYATRRKKSKEAKTQDSHPNWELWRADAERAGFRLGTVDERRPVEHDPFRAADDLRVRLLSSNGLAIEDAVFDHDSIRPAVARCGVGLGFSPAELDGFTRALTRDLVLVRDAVDPSHRLYTTQQILDAEALIAREQDRRMDHWVSITGPAGTGKSTACAVAVETIRSLKAVADGKSAHGPEAVEALFGAEALNEGQRKATDAILRAGKDADQVIVVSMAATTAERTGLKVKADQWGSVESVVQRIERGVIRTDRQTLLIVEEAGQLDTLRMEKLLKAVGDVRVVSLGDSGQLSAIGAAGWYVEGVARHGSVELTEVKRQKDQRDVEAAQAMREGRMRDAFDNLDERGRLHRAADDSERLAMVMDDYRTHRQAGRLAKDVRIVLDGSNEAVDTANRFVQRDRVERGEIAPKGVDVESAEGRRWQLHENDQIVMLETVFVRGEGPMKNGTTGTILKIDENKGSMRVRLRGEGEVNIPISAAVGLDYAKHVQKFQGGEVQVAQYVVAPQATRNSAYTAMTRGTDEIHVYTSGDVGRLVEQLPRIDAKESARAAFERIRGEAVANDLPPVRSEEIQLDDITFEPVPELDPVEPVIDNPARPRESEVKAERVRAREVTDRRTDPFDRVQQRGAFAQAKQDPFDRVEQRDPFDRPKDDPFETPDPFDRFDPPEISGDGVGH